MRKVEVKVVAEYWAYLEIDDEEGDVSEEELHKRAWKEFYDQAHQASIEEVKIEEDKWECEECGGEEYFDEKEDHECEEEESDNSEENDKEE